MLNFSHLSPVKSVNIHFEPLLIEFPYPLNVSFDGRYLGITVSDILDWCSSY